MSWATNRVFITLANVPVKTEALGRRFVLHSVLPIVLTACCIPTDASANPIYTWKDREGRTIYSSSPGSPRAKQRELPEIMKHSEPRASGTKKDPCESSGGKSCERGPAPDGSVQCKDGPPSERIAFRWHCPTAHLELREFEQPPGSNSVTVVVRNMREVEARQVTFRLATKKNAQLQASGPTEIGPLGIAQYVVYIPQGFLPGNSRRPAPNQLLITCSSCGQPVDNYR